VPALLEVREAALRAGEREVLREVSLEVAEGERVVLLGVNGCGKTTLLKALDGLLFPDRGEVRFRGTPLTGGALGEATFRRRFRSEVGLVFQNVDAMLFHPTVADEIAFGPRQLGLAGVEGRVARWAAALGVEGLLARPPFELSGGEKKRVALAAVLAVEPRLLLLDEVTAGMDPAWSARLLDLLDGLPGLAVVSATHNLSVAGELGDRAVLLRPDGAGVAFDGPPAALLADEALLVAAGLAHRHVHRHGARAHAHWHVHDPE
jgi:cobalt/nickel transport system ATP-binding protein